MGKKLTEIEAAIRVKMSPALLRWFTSHAPKHKSTRKLLFTEKDGEYFYDSDELDAFDGFLNEPWPCPPKQTRPTIPAGIEREIKMEAHYKCAFCEYQAHGEGAHIEPVAKTKCNHPHNLIWSCPNHHTEYDHGLKVVSELTEEEVKVVKKMLLDTQLRHWRIELREVDTILTLISEMEAVLGYLRDPKFAKIKEGLLAQARGIVASVNAAASKKDADGQKKGKTPAHYEAFLKKIGEITKTESVKNSVEDVLEDVSEATEEYLKEEELSKCPLCHGRGEHNEFRCPICEGEGTVRTEHLNAIDLRPYEQEKCPLCEGSGEHNLYRCPVCSGVGTVDVCARDLIDLKPYEQEDCPLCEGSGEHNRDTCPVCSGVGTVDIRARDFIDLKDYEQEECPLCEGSGKHRRNECPACFGLGHVDAAALNVIDLTVYASRECPLCTGSGDHRGNTCPVCDGEGEVDAFVDDNIDLSQFGAVECPLCDGETEFKGETCPLCEGEGNVERRVAEGVDLDVFYQ